MPPRGGEAQGPWRVPGRSGCRRDRRARVGPGHRGKSIPKMGASDFGYGVAEAFGLRIEPTRPPLVPLVLTDAQLEAIRVGAEGQRIAFQEGLLFTHRGLSGPSILEISSYWAPGCAI